jgi:aminoglycoside N3'-acetyltransferase
MVHASLRRVGPVEGGADGVIDAILGALGPDGVMMMPLGSRDDAPFDALRSPAELELGVLAEVFRQRPGVQVSDHPAARFAALGPEARSLLEPVPQHDFYGPGSALERLCRGGAVLRLGADPDTVTLTHYAEYLVELPHTRRRRVVYDCADGRRLEVDALDDCEGIVDWPGGDYFSPLLADYLATGVARIGPVGDCRAELLDAADYVAFAVDWMGRHLG